MSYQIVMNYDESIVTTIEIEPNTGSVHKRFYDFNVQDSNLWELCNDMHIQLEIYCNS